MASNDLIGVNTDKIDKLAMDSFDYIEKIMSTLDNISAQMDKVSESIDEENKINIISKYNNQKNEYANLKKILVRFPEELINAKSSSYTARDDLSENVRKDTEKFISAMSEKI